MVISLIKLSITIAVFGSKPEFGSSQNKYSGLLTIALAIATLFCIPPDASLGIFLFTLIRFTLFKTKLTLSRISSFV